MNCKIASDPICKLLDLIKELELHLINISTTKSTNFSAKIMLLKIQFSSFLYSY